jgi:transcription factor S
MEFCPKCGAILVKKTKNFGCPRCNYSTKDKIKLKTTETGPTKTEVAVISKKDTEILPVVEAECEKCKNKKAYFWTMQTRSSDEAETKFFKCTKCDHTWRNYD